MSDDAGLEMKIPARHSTMMNQSSSYVVEGRPLRIPSRSTVRAEKPYTLYPSTQQQRKDVAAQPPSRREQLPDRAIPRTTRFTEPKPMNLRMLNDDLGRGSSSATLASSVSSSEAAPASTAPTSLASTPNPSALITYFPTEGKLHELGTKGSAVETNTTVPTCSEDSEDNTPVRESTKDLKEREGESHKAARPKKLRKTATNTPKLAKVERKLSSDTTAVAASTVPEHAPKKSRWSWRRSKLPAGNNLVASH